MFANHHPQELLEDRRANRMPPPLPLAPGACASILLGALVLSSMSITTAYAQTAVKSAASCSQADVQAAINSATNGNTVLVPAGTCTWNSSVSISNKTIIIKGAGRTSTGTVINYGGSGHTLVNIAPGSQTGRVEVTGFKFSGGDSNYWSGMHIQFSGPNKWRNLRIYNNTFAGGRNNVIRGDTTVEGLIDNNIFQGSSHSIQFDGGGSADWSAPVEYGGPGFFFVENNTFDNLDTAGSTGWFAVDTMNGGKVVFRYNTLKNAFWENHDRCRNGLPSNRAFEIYNNTFTHDSSGWKAVDLSSGDGVIFGNTFSSSWSIAIGAYDSREGSCSLPGNEVLGAIAPVYTWGNKRQNGSSADTIKCTSSATACARMRFAAPGVQKPGYSPYTYPHPLASGSVAPPPPSDQQAPTTPSNLTATPQSTSVALFWSASSDNIGVTGYRVERCQGASCSNFALLSIPSGLSYTDKGLTASTAYRYRVQATDAAGNVSAYSNIANVTTSGAQSGATQSLFPQSVSPAVLTDSDTSSVNLGVKFLSKVAGRITGVRFFKNGSQNGGPHTGTLWTSTGTQLATGTFANETATGWQTLTFASPVTVQANTVYIASYTAPIGRYSATKNFFASSLVNGNLTAPSSGSSGGNGLYKYGARAVPTQTYQATNYFVDVVFQATP